MAEHASNARADLAPIVAALDVEYRTGDAAPVAAELARQTADILAGSVAS